ncbi:MAG TPA: M28 family peptidase [Candidatus Binatia bacterium]|nr:M28 family peptidase [Candidatus Binatia bacterium]
MKMCSLFGLEVVIAILLVFALVLPADDLTEAEKRIAANELYEFCRVLAAPEFAGRLTGHDGYTRAARWAAARFEEWGLRPLSEKTGFLQPYPSPYSVLEKAELAVELPAPAGSGEGSATRLQAELNRDFLPLVFSDSGRHAGAGTVFCGWGISAPELGYDDYGGIDARGKFVFCFRGTPDPKDRRYQVHDEHRRRMQTAKDKGALGIVYIYDTVQINPNGDVIRGFTPLMVSEAFADKLLAAAGLSCGRVKKDLLTYRRPLSFALAARIDYQVQSRVDDDGIGYNVAGWLEGSDPGLRREVVILGAHFDGCGEHCGLLFPGANDNASGSGVVLGAAKAAAALKTRPKRSLLFVLFGGEEKGLQGSGWFAGHLPGAFDKVAAMFNFDMEGEGDRAGVAVSPVPESLQAAILRADEKNKTLVATRVLNPPGVRGSDYAPFYNLGIPCASFWSNGPHIEYHTVGDTIYRLNPDILADICRLALRSAFLFADL